MGDILHLPPPEPFWFANLELLEELFRFELSLMNRLLTQHPELRSLLDTSIATVSDRKICFTVLAHRKALEMINEMFADRYENPSLTGEESKVVSATNSLVTSDAPDWILEMDRVVERLPNHLFGALPQVLRTGRFNENEAAQMEAIRSLSTIEQLQTLIETVLDQQLGRLEERWSATSSLLPSQPQRVNTKKSRRRRDKQRAERDKLIAEIADVAKTPTEFLRSMDERKVQPQPTWNEWPGSWGQAYQNPRLRTLIHQDKSRAISRARRHK
jgi:hypothetical protein